MSRFIVTLKRKIPITQGDVIDDFMKLNQNYDIDLVNYNFDMTFYINNDGTYGEIHGSFLEKIVDFSDWILIKEVREARLAMEQPRLDYMKDKIEVTRYLDWDDTGITIDFKPISEFVISDLILTQRFV